MCVSVYLYTSCKERPCKRWVIKKERALENVLAASYGPIWARVAVSWMGIKEEEEEEKTRVGDDKPVRKWHLLVVSWKEGEIRKKEKCETSGVPQITRRIIYIRFVLTLWMCVCVCVVWPTPAHLRHVCLQWHISVASKLSSGYEALFMSLLAGSEHAVSRNDHSYSFSFFPFPFFFFCFSCFSAFVFPLPKVKKKTIIFEWFTIQFMHLRLLGSWHGQPQLPTRWATRQLRRLE